MFKIISVKSSYSSVNVTDDDIKDVLNTQFLCKTQSEKKLISENINGSIDMNDISHNYGLNNIVRIFETSSREHNKNCMRAHDFEGGIDIRRKSRNRETAKTIVCVKPSVKKLFTKKKGRVK